MRHNIICYIITTRRRCAARQPNIMPSRALVAHADTIAQLRVTRQYAPPPRAFTKRRQSTFHLRRDAARRMTYAMSFVFERVMRDATTPPSTDNITAVMSRQTCRRRRRRRRPEPPPLVAHAKH